MSDQKISKKEQHYINNLLSNNENIVLETINTIKEEGSLALLTTLFDLLQTSSSEEVKKQVYDILCELKLTGAVPIIIDAINDEKYLGIQETLLRICWENGLDYTMHLPVFVNIIIHGDFMNSFEAFTVVENMERTFPAGVADEMVMLLRKARIDAPEQKEALIGDLIAILQ